MKTKAREDHLIVEHELDINGVLKIAGAEVTSSAAELNLMDGVTATAAELNKNAGVTAGTATASKTAVLGTNKNLDEFHTAALYLGAAAGTQVTKTAAQINALLEGVAGGYKVARGQHTTIAASDTVVTGLATVVAAIAVLESDPTSDPLHVSCAIGNQAGAPAAGSIYIKTWKPTAADNTAPIAATTFTKLINWIAIGT